MSKAWATAHGAEKPASIKANTANFASTNTDGTGPYQIQSRQAGVKTTLVPNPAWWGQAAGHAGPDRIHPD